MSTQTKLPNGQPISHDSNNHLIWGVSNTTAKHWWKIVNSNDEIQDEGYWTPSKGKTHKTSHKISTTEDTIDTIKISDCADYSPLNKYQGIEGNLPCRANTTYVGVEIELEKVAIKHNLAGTWSSTEDGSLKDNGVEFITIPIQFRYLEIELQRLFDNLENCHASQRCSIHVHLNSRDFTLQELASFIALYMIFEKSMYNYSGGRWNNNFCVPLFFSPNIVRNYIINLFATKNIYHTWHKYFGLNISPLFGGESKQIGTIEFRHMKGNLDIKYIINWINLIVSLKIAAKKLPYKEIISHLETMNTTSGYYWLCNEVFKDFAPIIHEQPTFKKDIEACISQTKTVFLTPKETKEVLCVG